MAENTPNPPVALQDDQDLWLVSYSDDDDREMSALQIAAALSRGEIDANTIVWRDGMPEWKAIAEVDVLKEQLRQVSTSPEAQRKRSTVIGGFGPAQPFRADTTAAPPPPAAAPTPIPGFDDDEPTVVKHPAVQGFSSSPTHASPGPAPSRSRHPTSGNTLRIRTGGEPVTLRTPTPPRSGGFEPETPEAELESIPSALLVTATNNTEVEEAVNTVKQRISTTPPLPARGVMTRSSDAPHDKVSANLPRATLTRDGESSPPGPTPRVTDAPKPPVPKRSLAEGADSLSPDDFKSEADSSLPDANGPETPRYKTPVASVQLRDDVEQVYSADLQKTRPPRGRREPMMESGTPPPIGELSEVASRIARSTQSHAPSGVSVPESPPKSSNGRLIGWLLFGIAAVAGAFTLGRRSSEPSAETKTQGAAATHLANVSAAASTINATNAQLSETPLESRTDGAEAVTTSSADSTYISLATKPAPAQAPVAVAGKAVAQAPARPTPDPTPAKVTAPPAATPPANATPTPQAGPATSAEATPATPGPFDSTAAANALAFAANKASSCRQPGDPSGIARVTVTFTNSGKSTHALVDGPPFAGTATGGCIASTMRSATVPPFTGDRVTVKKTVVIQ